MIKFGVAGNSLSFYEEGYKYTSQSAKWCRDRDIDIFEYSFGKGVRMNNETAKVIGKTFKDNCVELSVHAPYYINLANPDENKIKSSIGYIIQTINKLKQFNYGDRMVVHPASQGKISRNIAVNETIKNLQILSDIIESNHHSDVKICLETMGKLGQIGTVEEIVDFCKIASFYYPCMDFGHINARTFGSIKSANDYEMIVKYMLDNLPREKVENMHIHFSKIMYGKSGEIKHLTFADCVYGPEFEPLAEILVKYNLHPKIICESDGTQAEDVILMKNIYKKMCFLS